MISILKDKPVLRFALIFLLCLIGFYGTNSIQPIKDAHHEFYAKIGGWVFNSWHPDVKVDITTEVEKNGGNPTNDYFLTAYDKDRVAQIKSYNRQNPGNPQQLKPIAYMSFKARMNHAIATFFLLSLIIATPNSWKRKVIGSIIAIYILYILVSMKITFLMNMNGANADKSSSDGLWYAASGVIGNNELYLELYYILIISIWLLVSISKESINKLTGLTS